MKPDDLILCSLPTQSFRQLRQMDCAICLNHIERKNEAYLYPCFHFYCLKCIQEWTEQQRQHESGTACPNTAQPCSFACPLCKRPYTYIVYDCIGTSYRLIPMCGQPSTMSAMPLTPEQSRRRALYVTPDQLTAVPQSRSPGRPRMPTDQQTTKWIQRELQAVLLAEDVNIIVQHVTGVLQKLSSKPHACSSLAHQAESSPLYGTKAVFIANVSQALAAFTDEHSEKFAEHLWHFLHSGLIVAAYDKLVFGEQEEAQQQEEDQGRGHPWMQHEEERSDW